VDGKRWTQHEIESLSTHRYHGSAAVPNATNTNTCAGTPSSQHNCAIGINMAWDKTIVKVTESAQRPWTYVRHWWRNMLILFTIGCDGPLAWRRNHTAARVKNQKWRKRTYSGLHHKTSSIIAWPTANSLSKFHRGNKSMIVVNPAKVTFEVIQGHCYWYYFISIKSRMIFH